MGNMELRKEDITQEFLQLCEKEGYVCVDTETTGLNYKTDRLCTIQLYCKNTALIIQYNPQEKYKHMKELFLSDDIIKVFHNAVFDVAFLMKNLKLCYFGRLVCTKISAKLLHGLEHKNSLKNLLNEYLEINVDKSQQLSDWTVEALSDNQKQYAINDVKYLYCLWNKMKQQIERENLSELAYKCFEFVPNYVSLTDMNIDNIFVY